MGELMFIQTQLLATKFFVPAVSHPLIDRHHLSALLKESMKHSLTLISAPAGFGKTTLLSAWEQSLSANHCKVAWLSLDEEDNDPQLFWTYILSALDQRQPERFTPLLKHLQSPETPALNYILTSLINLLVDSMEQFVLILDDYHVITEQQVHTTLSYLVEHLPTQLHIFLATRTDPPLPLSQLRAHGQMLEVRTDQLRCTAEETKAFFKEVMDIQLPDETIQEVTVRTEGWLVGLQLLGLSLCASAYPTTLLEEVSGDQHYILDYLTEEVLQRQSQDIQTFLLSTCILDRLNASLCNAVMQQTGSQQMLERLEQGNLFVISLDHKRHWYRYHALFAQALCYRLEQIHADLLPDLHYRASLWYAQHNQTTQAILHAFGAHQWQWAADLIEHLPLLSHTWGMGEHELVLLRQWLEQLPTDIVRSRPRLCLALAQLLWAIASPPILEAWLDAAQASLTTSLTQQTHHPVLTSKMRQEQENLLGEVISTRAFLQSTQENGQAALSLCQQALALLSTDNFIVRALVATTQLIASYSSSANNAVAAIQSGLQAGLLAKEAEQIALSISAMSTTARYMIGAGRLHETLRLTQQAMLWGTKSGGLVLPEKGWPALFQADILREWNQLDAALSLAEEAISLCKQAETITSLTYVFYGYAVLLRIFLSRRELATALSTLQQLEHIGMSMNQPYHIYIHSFFTTIDQVRLWLACGDLDRAIYWVNMLECGKRYGTLFTHEREEVACARIFLAKAQPALALERLTPVLERATTGQRWGHVIEIRLLQALAYQMRQEEDQALDALSQAVHLAEPEGYIRSFVDEGVPMIDLLSRLREQQRQSRPTSYLDRVIAAFSSSCKKHKKGDFVGTPHAPAGGLASPCTSS